MNLPLYRAKKIDSDECIEGYYSPDKNYQENIHTIFYFDVYFEVERKTVVQIDASTLEISDGLKWRKLYECNFRTDYELDMHGYNGYKEGWNNALSEGGIPPHIIAKSIIKNNKQEAGI